MIYITGDIHGDITRFSDKKLRKLKKNDCLIVCGDFGFIWDGSKKEESILKKLGKKRYNILFVDGCHENFSLLNSYPESDWNGGKVHIISGRLMHLMRGNIYKIGDTRLLAFGGGQSDDADLRKTANTWWKEEVPEQSEIDYAKERLKSTGNIVDYIVTHEPPASLKDFLQIDTEQKSEMGAYFDSLRTECRFKRWFFGKCHMNKVIPPQYHAVFNDIIKID
ncbi:MAG TPA: metallophosphoesterase [Oscillospiraceae bacterium]|nr:metallophosphoesterase [Oscillospiraceae bacterium]